MLGHDDKSRYKSAILWSRTALLIAALIYCLYCLSCSLDYLHRAACAQSLGAGTSVQSINLDSIATLYEMAYLALGAGMCCLWPGSSKWRGLWRAFLFLLLAFPFSIVLSMYYEHHIVDLRLEETDKVNTNSICSESKLILSQ